MGSIRSVWNLHPNDPRGRSGTGWFPHDEKQLYDGHRESIRF
jgi:hypothetical protein